MDVEKLTMELSKIKILAKKMDIYPEKAFVREARVLRRYIGQYEQILIWMGESDERYSLYLTFLKQTEQKLAALTHEQITVMRAKLNELKSKEAV